MKINKKNSIISNATENFSKYGYYATSLEDIAKACDISKAAIYYHFKDKKALYDHIITEHIASLAKEISEAVNLTENPDKDLSIYIETFGDFLVKHPHFAAILSHEFANEGINLNNEAFKNLSIILQTITQILNTGIEKGLFEIQNPMVTQMTIVSTLLMHQTTKVVRNKVTQLVSSSMMILPEPTMDDFSKTLSRKILKSIKRG